MSRSAVGVGLLLVLVAAVPNPMVPFPANFRQALVKYAIVDRIDSKSRDLYISKQGLDALKQGQPMPVGTVLAIESFTGNGTQDPKGRMGRAKEDNQLHVMVKLHPGEGIRVWGFGAFTLDGGPEPRINELPGFCLACHQIGVPTGDPLITAKLLKDFVASGELQHQICQRAEREPC